MDESRDRRGDEPLAHAAGKERHNTPHTKLEGVESCKAIDVAGPDKLIGEWAH